MTEDDFDLFAPEPGELDLALEDVAQKASRESSAELPSLAGPATPHVEAAPAAPKPSAAAPDEIERAARFGSPGEGWRDHARYALRVWSRLSVNAERIALAERRLAAAVTPSEAGTVRLEIDGLRRVPERVDGEARKRGLTVLVGATLVLLAVAVAVASFG